MELLFGIRLLETIQQSTWTYSSLFTNSQVKHTFQVHSITASQAQDNCHGGTVDPDLQSYVNTIQRLQGRQLVLAQEPE